MIINNPNDPLSQGKPAGLVLMEKMNVVAKDFPLDAVVDAATNIVLNAIRQSAGNRIKALMMFDELFSRSKSVLAAHYDGISGKPKNIFAHTQHIVMDTFKDPEGL